MPNSDTNIHDISGQVAFAQVGGNLTGDIIAGNKTIIQNIIQQAAKQIVAAPYKFLASYDISDRDIFFGRAAVIEELVGKLPRYKTLVINGRSGSGKTSLINAGLIPRLAENGYQYISFRDYTDPLRQLREHVAHNGLFKAYAEQTSSLFQFLNTVTRQQRLHVAVIFDQFERFFLKVPAATRVQFIQEIKACLDSDLTGAELDLIFAQREDFFGQFTREFSTIMPAFIKETDLFSLSPLSRAEARDAIVRPLERLTTVKLGYDETFVDEVLLPGLMGESFGGVTIDPPHLQIVCNQLYEQAKIRYAAKLERGGVVEIDRVLYDELHGATGILQSYLDDRLAKIVSQLPDGQAVLRSMLKTMVATTGTRTFVALPDVQRRLSDVTPETVADGLRLLREERIIEMRGQDEAATYSLSHEVMVAKVQSWFDERELQRKKAQETLERGLAEWQSSQALLNENQVKQIRQWAQPEDLTAQAEELLTNSQHAYEEKQRKDAEQERRIRRNRNAFQMALGVGLVIALILTALAFWQRNVADRRARIALAQAISFQALDQQEYYKDTLAALLARQAYLLNERAQGTTGWAQIDKALRSAVDVLRFKVLALSHQSVVLSVGFSPDGQTIASGSGDGTIRLWNVNNGEERVVLRGHRDGVLSLAFSPDGQTLASASYDQTVRLWDLASEKERNILRGHVDWVESVVFSPDGQILASGSRDGTVRLWNVTTGIELTVLSGHEAGVNSVAFSPDAKTLASASWDNTVRLWDVSTALNTGVASKKERKVLWGEANDEPGVYSVAFSPDGTTLAWGNNDHTVRLWDSVRGIERAVLRGHAHEVKSVAFSPDGQTLASASWDNTVRLWDVTTALNTGVASTIEYKVLRGHMKLVCSVAFSPDGQTVASASWDETVRLWNLESGTERNILRGHEGDIYSLAFSPDGQTLASGSWDHTVRLWDVASGVERKNLRGHGGNVYAVVFSPDGKILASGGEDVRLWDVASGAERKILHGHTENVYALAFSPDGRTLASGSMDNTIRLWDVASGAEWKILRGHTKNVNSVAFSPDGKTLASGSWDMTVRLWDVASGAEQKILRGHGGYVYAVVFSPDGATLASGASDNVVRLWNPANGKERFILRGYMNLVSSLSFNPDGKTLASGSWDNTIRLWNPASGTERAVLQGHENNVWVVTFSPDGQILASASKDKTIRFWTWRTQALADMVCQKVWRNLTWDEWQEFFGKDIPYERTCPDLPEHPSVAEARRTPAETQ